MPSTPTVLGTARTATTVLLRLTWWTLRRGGALLVAAYQWNERRLAGNAEERAQSAVREKERQERDAAFLQKVRSEPKQTPVSTNRQQDIERLQRYVIQCELVSPTKAATLVRFQNTNFDRWSTQEITKTLNSPAYQKAEKLAAASHIVFSWERYFSVDCNQLCVRFPAEPLALAVSCQVGNLDFEDRLLLRVLFTLGELNEVVARDSDTSNELMDVRFQSTTFNGLAIGLMSGSETSVAEDFQRSPGALEPNPQDYARFRNFLGKHFETVSYYPSAKRYLQRAFRDFCIRHKWDHPLLESISKHERDVLLPPQAVR